MEVGGMMLSKRWQGLLMMSLVVTLTLAFAGPAFAQRDTGVMIVRAIDPDGAPLPGVQVVASGPVGTQTQYTGVDGTARFPGLYPGDGYTATFALDGFKTIIREGLEISADRTTSFDMTMELATVEETITVTGESPLVDTKSTSVTGLYSDDLIDMTPTASGLWAGVLDHVPGILQRNDVGGNDSGQQTSPRAWGSETRNNSYNVNGGDTSDPAAVGASSSYFAVGAFEEVSVSMAAQDIEIKTPGINMNMVVKSGSNDWHAGVKYFYEGPSLVSSNVDAELIAQGITEGTPNELLSDLDIQGGGPIWPNRAWFFIDYWNFEIKKVVLGLEERDGTALDDWTFNVNAQVSDNHKISGRYIKTIKYRNNRGASRNNPYNGRIQDSGSHIPQVQWQAVLTQNLFMDIRFSVVRSNFPLERRDADSLNPMPGYVDRPARYDFSLGRYVKRPANPSSEFFDNRDTDSLNGTASWYQTGENTTHDVKFGGNYQFINYFAPSNVPNGYRPYVRSSRIGDPTHDPTNNPNWALPENGGQGGVPVEVRLYRNNLCFVRHPSCWAPDHAEMAAGRAMGIFAQDTLTIANRLTIVAGFRYDRAWNWVPAQSRLAGPWCGLTPALANPAEFCGLDFEATDIIADWRNLTPRIGLIYDIQGDGRWAAKFNYARYAENLGLSWQWGSNLNGNGSEDWNWFDPNGDGVFQYGEQTTYRSRSFPGLGTKVDPTMVSPMTNEWTFGIEHELRDNMLVNVTGIIRGRNDDAQSANIGRPFGPMIGNTRCQAECTPTWGADDSPRPLVDPYFETVQIDPGADGIIGTADDGGPVPVWALDPLTFGTAVNLSTNINQWGFDDYLDYKGLQIVLSKRWSDNWQVLASYDYGYGYQSGASTSANGTWNGRRQQMFGSRPHQFKVTGNYLFAEPVGVNLGLFLRMNSGEPVMAYFSYDSDLIEPPFSPYTNQGSSNMAVDGRGEGNNGRPEREAFTTIVDVRAEKQLTIGRYGVLHFYVDVFNLLNSNIITEFDWDLGPEYMDIQDILPPRVIRLGGAWDF
jgi:hypothetical protein